MTEIPKEVGSESRMAECEKGYDRWEESCLVKFSGFLGFSVKGHEEEILSLMRKLSFKRNQEEQGLDGFIQV